MLYLPPGYGENIEIKKIAGHESKAAAAANVERIATGRNGSGWFEIKNNGYMDKEINKRLRGV